MLALSLVALAIIANVSSALAATATLIRSPYVQQVYTNSLIVAWTTVEDGASQVNYGTSDYSQTAVATSTLFTTGEAAPYDSYYVHEATLTGLSPDTAYQYKIFTNSLDITPDGSINVRSAKPSSSTSFRFAAFGDSGQDNQGQRDVAARLLQVQPDVVVHTGDLIYSTSTYTHFEERYFQIYDELIKSVWLAPSPGNHDTDYNGGQSYVDVFMNPENGAADAIEREMYYSFDYANAHFTVVTPEVSYNPGSVQYNWLINDLASSSQFWKFVVFHVPPYYTNDTQGLAAPGGVANTLVPLFELYDVDIVFSGDRHWYERFNPLNNGQLATIEEGGILYVITAGGGAGLGQIGTPPWNVLTAEKARLFHLTLLEVNDCEVQLSAVTQSAAGDPFDNSDIFDSYLLDRCSGPPTARFKTTAYAISETGSPEVTVTVALTRPHDSTITVNYATSNGTAVSPGDYTPASGPLVFNPTETEKTFTVSIVDDTDTEDPEQINLTLTGASVSAPSSATITILDDDTPEISFSQAQYVVNEDATNAALTVSLSAISNKTVTVAYASTNGTAAAGVDYSAVSNSLTFLPGETSHPISVPILEDALDETDETFSVELMSAQNGSPGGPATITIVDNDDPPLLNFAPTNYNVAENGGVQPLTVQLSAVSGQPVTVSYLATGGTATAGSDYTLPAGLLTFAPGELSSTFNITGLDDNLEEGSESILISLSGAQNATTGANNTATVTILDDDGPPEFQFNAAAFTASEGDAFAKMTVVLTGYSENTVRVGYSINAGTAVPGSDYTASNGTLDFSPGVASQDIMIPLLDDNISEGDETLTVTLSNVAFGIPGTPIEAQLVITDNDPLPVANLDIVSQTVSEKDGDITLSVELSAVSEQTVEVEYTVETSANVLNIAEKFGSGKLIFARGERIKSFQVAIPDDGLDEPDEHLIVNLVNPKNVVVGPQGSAEIIVEDDDPPVSLAFARTNYFKYEGSGEATIEVVLSGVSGHVITVNYASQDLTATAGSDYVAVNNTLTFAPGETSQTFTVQLLSDTESETDETLSLKLSAATHANLGPPIITILTLTESNDYKTFLPMINRKS